MVLSAIAYIGTGLLVIVVVGGLGLLYYAREYSAPVPPAVPGTIRVACVGDSITYGALVKNRKVNCYPAQLEKLLGPGYSVRNFGVNGHALQKASDKPYWTHKHFKGSSDFEPHIVLIMLGTNDAAEQNWHGLEPYIADYRAMLAHYGSLPSRPVIYMLTPPTQFPVENATRVVHKMNDDKLTEITGAIKKLGEELKVGVIDVNRATKSHPEFFVFDGLHPDDGGARLIAETVCAFLKAHGA